jgi:predicted phage terminase large subunit-like protein
MALFIKTIRENPYIKQKPTAKQAEFLMKEGNEGLFGGSAGGGKSSTLLMAALQYVMYPNYHALLLRRSFKDLALPGALMDRAFDWLHTTDAHWDDLTKTWEFPSGATVSFGYLEAERDKFRYQGSELQMVGFDEASQFLESQYTYLFSRLRRPKDSFIPIRMRCCSNPGDIGAEWVKARFITYDGEDRFFIPSRYTDNPYLDQKEYEQSLDKLDPITRAQLKEGNWDVSFSSGLFRREWFEFVDFVPNGHMIRVWDTAATEQVDYNNPDFTAGCLMVEKDGTFYIKDVVRARKKPGDIEKLIRHTAEMDGIRVRVIMLQEPASSGINMIDHYAKQVMKGFAFYGFKPTGDKVVNAQPLSAAASHGNVKLSKDLLTNMELQPNGTMKSMAEVLLSEFQLFPLGKHDDVVDATSTAFNQLSGALGRSDRFLTMVSRRHHYK